MCGATSQVPESPMQSSLRRKAGNSLDDFKILTTFKIVGNHSNKDIFNQLFTHLMMQLDHKSAHLPFVLMILKLLPTAFLCWLWCDMVCMRHYEGIRNVAINPRAALLFQYFTWLRKQFSSSCFFMGIVLFMFAAMVVTWVSVLYLRFRFREVPTWLEAVKWSCCHHTIEVCLAKFWNVTICGSGHDPAIAVKGNWSPKSALKLSSV